MEEMLTELAAVMVSTEVREVRDRDRRRTERRGMSVMLPPPLTSVN